MLFNSYEFILVYLPIVIIVFFLLGKYFYREVATVWLVVASLFFYGYWDYHYVPLLLVSICYNYFIGELIANKKQRKMFLVIGIIGNLLLLGYFKYTNFFLDTIYTIIGQENYGGMEIVLPLGISFFTFTQSAYLVDVYRRETANQSFITYCEFVTIFPHLIAGPIINHREMIPQFTAKSTFSFNPRNMVMGICLFTMGLFKKVIVADSLSPWVSNVFSRADSLTFIEAWIGALSYTFQLYFDFSGYSEMAMGLGLMINLNFPVNFDSPYQARSIIDFWRRWHMTLGNWVKNYLYIPLGGNRRGEFSKMRNLFVSMTLIGLWHGAGWTFVAWGGTHGLMLMVNHLWRRVKLSMPKGINWLLTFLCVVVCWVMFRADNIHDGLVVLQAMLNIQHIALPNTETYINHCGFLQAIGVGFIPWRMDCSLFKQCVILFTITIALMVSPNPQRLLIKVEKNRKILLGMAVLIGIMFYTSLMTIGNVQSEFLYFQF